MAAVVTVLLVDDDAITLDFLEAWLTQNCFLPYEFQILNRVQSGRMAIDMLQNQPTPDLLILDLNLPDMNGMAVAEFVQTLLQPPLILLFSGYEDWLEWRDTANLSIRGYVVKGGTVETLEYALDKILMGDIFWDPVVYYHMHQKARQGYRPIVWHDPLTEREKEVFRLLCKGYKQAQIASELFLSTNTVKTHLRKICKKAGCPGLAVLRGMIHNHAPR